MDKFTVIQVEPGRLRGVHKVWDHAKVADLIERIRACGWQDFPLLAEPCQTWYVAWTGTHRIEAAQRLKQQGHRLTVPVVTVDVAKLLAAGFMPDQRGLYNCGTDAMRLARLRDAGDTPGYEVMLGEVRNNPEALYEYLDDEGGKLSEFFSSQEEWDRYIECNPEVATW